MRTENVLWASRVFLGVLVLGLCGLVAVAQEAAPGAGPRAGFGPNEKAWELQAKCVAQSMELSPELTAKLVEAYKAARNSQGAALRALREGGGQRDPGQFTEVNKAEKAKLEEALKGFLNPEQTAKALATLGTFSRQWDRQVVVLDGMGLEDSVKAQAMKLVANCAVESDKVMQAALAEGTDFRAIREKTAPLREKLDAELAKILSEEQMAKWKEGAAMRRPPRPAEEPSSEQPKPEGESK